MAATPDTAGSAGVATMSEPPASSGPYPVPDNYAPYFERSFAVTEAVPNAHYDAPAPFGPIMMFETNLNSGLGYDDGYQRINARVPYHIIPNTNVLIGDFSASVTYSGAPIANGGLVYRRYDDLRNRVFGVNTFIDYDQGYGNTEWYRGTIGVESLGQYIDFRANGYFVLGDDSLLLSDTPGSSLFLQGNNIFRSRTQVRENAYSGFDAEVGGPLPVLGQYGLNMYAGGYLLGNDNGYDTVGFQARWEALITQNLTVNTYLSTDDTFGTNTWVGIQYELPNYKNRRTLRPRGPVRERLQDPVVRSTRIHTNLDTRTFSEACINDVTGNPFFIAYVDPNINTPGTGAGTFEDPFRSMAALTNGPGIDVIRVTPNTDGSGVDLTVNGGLSLFDNQALISSNSDYELFRIGTTPFYIPGTGETGPGPLLTRPNIGAGDSIVRLANNNTISGMRFDASNADGTIFGNGISNPLPITDVNLTGNTFANYVVGADLQDVSGRVIVDGNTFTGRSPVAAIRSTYGLKMNVAGNQTMDLLLNGNTATTNQVAGLSVTAGLNSTLNADDLNGNTAFVPPATGKYVYDAEVTGITDNVLTGNGNGIEVIGQTGSTINAAIEDNVTNAAHAGGDINVDAQNGILARTDGGTFNLASLRDNTTTGQYDANSLVAPVTNENGVLLHYLNGGTFLAQSEDVNEDKNFNGVLDAGEDLDGDAVLDVANGVLDIGEDLNGNGILDQGIVSNIFQNNVGVGLCIFGETAGVGGFMIGGPVASLGNTARNNGNAGIAMDLNGTAVASVDSMFNTITRNGDGMRFNLADSSNVTHFNSINDSLTLNDGTGISIVAADTSIIDALTIQGASILDNTGRGINIEARDNAVITANSTIGGFDPSTLGQNIISGTSFTEANIIRRNSSDGIRVLASGNGVVNGNLINNTIEDNLGDGAALIIDDGGTLNFGNLANNEVISRNTIRNNSGAGLRMNSRVSPATTGVLNAIVQGNTISGNASGGIVSELTGLHSAPPTNNTLNLTVNDAAYLDRTAEQNRNFITNNGDVGIGVNVTGNGFATVNLNNVSVTGTFDGADPLRNGDGIALTRAGASLLTATLNSVDVTGNTGDGLEVDAQGNDKTDPKQPDSGTPNTVTVTDSNFSNNGQNGAVFRSRGNATLIGDVSQSTFSGNGANGILVNTSQAATFGDPTIGLPPGRRSVFDGNTITNNAVDGVQINATEDSKALVEITSNLAPVVPSPHAAANSLGTTSISNNGRDGVRITTNGGRSDILITSGTATTLIDGKRHRCKRR